MALVTDERHCFVCGDRRWWAELCPDCVAWARAQGPPAINTLHRLRREGELSGRFGRVAEALRLTDLELLAVPYVGRRGVEWLRSVKDWPQPKSPRTRTLLDYARRMVDQDSPILEMLRDREPLGYAHDAELRAYLEQHATYFAAVADAIERAGDAYELPEPPAVLTQEVPWTS